MRTSANDPLYGQTNTEVNPWNFTGNDMKAREQLLQEDGSAKRAFIDPYGELGLTRLSACLRHRVPVAKVQEALGGISPE